MTEPRPFDTAAFAGPTPGMSHEATTAPGRDVAFDAADAPRPLGRFHLLERLGAGAFGAVWKAHDTELDRVVALKVPHAGLLAQEAELERFQREARAAAQLRHPGIVAVHEVAVPEGLPVLVEELVPGASLKDLLESRRLTCREAAALVADIAEAVHYAHRMGVVHRDLKPGNVLIAPAGEGDGATEIGRPVVTDFGLALRQGQDRTLTAEGALVGTPAYMSPEQARGEGHWADARSDVYSLGVMLYEMLTGELPFRGPVHLMLLQVLGEEPRPPRKANPKVPRDLETVCLKAMAKEPRRRFATAGDLADELRRWLAGEPVRARPVGRLERARKWARRNPVVAGLLAAVLVTLAAGTVVSILFALQARQRADDLAVEKDRSDGHARRAQQKEQEATRALEEVETTLLGNLLRPIGLINANLEGKTLSTLGPFEKEALVQLQGLSSDRMRLHFLALGLQTPESAQRLGRRADWVAQAAVGLDMQRRQAAGQLLRARLEEKGAPEAVRLACARLGNALEVTNEAFNVLAVEALLTAVEKGRAPLSDLDGSEEAALLNDLVAALDRLGPQAASALAGRAAELLARRLTSASDDKRIAVLHTALTAVAGRLDAAGAWRAADVLVTALARSTGVDIRPLGAPLALVAGRLSAAGASRAAQRIVAAMTTTTEPVALWQQSRGLGALLGPLDEAQAAHAAAQAANVLLAALARNATPPARSTLVRALAAIGGRLDAVGASRVADALLRLMTDRPNPVLLYELSRALAVVLDRAHTSAAADYPRRAAQALLDGAEHSPTFTRQLLHGLEPLIGRLDALTASACTARAAKSAARAAEALATDLARILDRDASASRLGDLAVLCTWLDAASAARVAEALIAAMGKTTSAIPLHALSQGLETVSARLDVASATALAARAAEALVAALVQAKDPYALPNLSQELTAMAARLDAAGATRLAESVLDAMTRTTSPPVLNHLTRGLVALAARIDDAHAHSCWGKAAEVVLTAMALNKASPQLGSLWEALAVIGDRLDAEHADRVVQALVAMLDKVRDVRSAAEWTTTFKAVGNRLDRAAAGKLAERLVPAMTQATDINVLSPLKGALAAVAGRLGPEQADRAARTLVAAMSKTTSVELLEELAQGIAAVLGQLDAAQASAHAGKAVAPLLEALDKTIDFDLFGVLPAGVAALGGWLDADHAGKAIRALVAALAQTTDPEVLTGLSVAVVAVAGRLDPAAADSAAQVLLAAMTKATGPQALEAYFRGLLAVLVPLDAARARHHAARAADVLLEALSQASQMSQFLSLLQDLKAVSKRLGDAEAMACARRATEALITTLAPANRPHQVSEVARLLSTAAQGLPTPDLAVCLRHPLAAGHTSRALLDVLGQRCRREFRSTWQFLDWAASNGVGLVPTR